MSVKPGEGELLAAMSLRLAHAAGVPAEQRAGGDVVHHRHLGERLHDLKGAGEAAAARSGSGFARVMSRPSKRTRPAVPDERR